MQPGAYLRKLVEHRLKSVVPGAVVRHANGAARWPEPLGFPTHEGRGDCPGPRVFRPSDDQGTGTLGRP
jgi:hypothetical protein